MRFLDAASQKLPPIGCALLATASLSLSIRSATSCQFLKISYAAFSANEDGFIVPNDSEGYKDSDEYERDKYRIGVLCPSQYYNREGDMMWNLARYFMMAAFALLGVSLLWSWGMSTCFMPTYRNWKFLSVASILAAGVQIPVFLIFTAEPCQIRSAQCSTSTGFFMLLWSTVLLCMITVLTQCFDYPLWREEMERWKVKEYDYPIYDHEDSLDVEYNYNEPSTTVHHRLVSSLPRFQKRKSKARRNGSIPVQQLNEIKHLKQEKRETDLHLLSDAVENTSQCLSGLSVDMPPMNDDMQAMLTHSQEEDDKNIPQHGGSKLYNEEWGERARAREAQRAASENQMSLSPSNKKSPGRTKVLKRGKSHISYSMLSDDNSSESYSDDFDNGKTCFDLKDKFPIRLTSSFEESHYDLELNDSSRYIHDTEENTHDNDTESNLSSTLGGDILVVDLSTGGRQAISIKDDISESDVNSFPPKRHKMPLPPVVSDDDNDEDEDHNDDSLEIPSFAQHVDTPPENWNESKLPSTLRPKYAKPNITQIDNPHILPRDKDLTDLFEKYTELKNQFNELDGTKDSSVAGSSRWRDVLDTTTKNNHQNQNIIKYQDSDDFDDEHDHVAMMEALTRRPTFTASKAPQSHFVPSTLGTNTTGTHPNNMNRVMSHIIVSDDEDETSSLGHSSPARISLYPDEVEV